MLKLKLNHRDFQNLSKSFHSRFNSLNCFIFNFFCLSHNTIEFFVIFAHFIRSHWFFHRPVIDRWNDDYLLSPFKARSRTAFEAISTVTVLLMVDSWLCSSAVSAIGSVRMRKDVIFAFWYASAVLLPRNL